MAIVDIIYCSEFNMNDIYQVDSKGIPTENYELDEILYTNDQLYQTGNLCVY